MTTQKNNIQPTDPMPYVIAAVVILFAFILFCSLISCNSAAKRIAKAEQTVLTDAGAFQRVGTKFRDLNPCANDTTFITSRDTITTTETEYLPGDTVRTADTVRITLPGRVVTNTLRIRDTLRVLDRYLVAAWQDSAAMWQRQYLVQVADTERVIAEREDAEDKARTRLWLLIGVGAAGVLFGFRKKIPFLS